MNNRTIYTHLRTLTVCGAAMMSVSAYSQTPVWYDGYATTSAGNDITAQLGSPRQGGDYVPTSYVANSLDQATDYHQQLIGPGGGSDRLMLAGDGGQGTVLVSPLLNFNGMTPSGVMGTRIAFDLNVGALVLGNSNSFVQAGLSIGGDSTLIGNDSSASHFGVRFIEDNFGGNGNFIQLFDGNTLVGNLISNPAGAGSMNVYLDVSDPLDLNPWNGVGSTKIDLFVNATQVASYTKGGGGYANNYITLEGSANMNGMGLATHHFDELTVYASPVPEPSSLALAALGAIGVFSAVRRRR